MLSPWHNSGASVQVTITPCVSDGNPGYEFGGFADDHIWANGPRPGRVSAVEERRFDSHTDFDVISVSRAKKIPFGEPTRLITPTHFTLHPTANHPTYHHSSWYIYQALTQIRPSNNILTKGSKLRSPADFSESRTQKWKLRRAPGSG